MSRLVSEMSQDILTVGSGGDSIPGRHTGRQSLTSKKGADNHKLIGTWRDQVVKLSVPYVKIPEGTVVRTRIR